jgi:hypothetical protein
MLKNNCKVKPFLWHIKRNSWVKVWFEMQRPGVSGVDVRSWKSNSGKGFKHTAKSRLRLRWHGGAPALVVGGIEWLASAEVVVNKTVEF